MRTPLIVWVNSVAALLVLAFCLACASPERPSTVSSGEAALTSPMSDAEVQARREIQVGGRIDESRDEFTRATSLLGTYRFSLESSALLLGVSTVQGDLRLTFKFIGGEWRYLRCHAVAALIDNQPVPLPEFRHDGEAVRYGVVERVFADVPPELIERMSTASDVRFRVCNTVVTFDARKRASLQTYMLRWRRMTAAVNVVAP